MIGVNLQEGPEAVEALGKAPRIPFPLALEADDRVERLFGIRACPSAALIDRKGRIVGRIVGERDWRSEAARGLVRSLLESREPLAAQEARPAAAAKRLRKAVHLVSAVRPNDPKLTEILDEAAASLKAADEVVILFDGQSVGALRMNARREKKTPLEEAQFAKQERQTLAKRLGVRYSAAPRNQLEYIQRLARAGAKVFVNSNSVRLHGLADSEIHPIAKPVPMAQMEELVDQSDACYTYGGH